MCQRPCHLHFSGRQGPVNHIHMCMSSSHSRRVSWTVNWPLLLTSSNQPRQALLSVAWKDSLEKYVRAFKKQKKCYRYVKVISVWCHVMSFLFVLCLFYHLNNFKHKFSIQSYNVVVLGWNSEMLFQIQNFFFLLWQSEIPISIFIQTDRYIYLTKFYKHNSTRE